MPKQQSISSNWKKLRKVFMINQTLPKKQPAPVVVEPVVETVVEEEELANDASTTERDLSILESILSKPLNSLPSDDESEDQKVSKKHKREIIDKTRSITIQSTDTVKSNFLTRIGKFLAIDCEMVGVGPLGVTSVLARVSIVNYHGQVVLDEYVHPQEHVVDYRTHVSGITPRILKEKAIDFKTVQKRVADIIKDKIIIGHALKNDLDALMLDHPRKLLRDTARYKPLKNPTTKHAQSLKNLAKALLSKDIQTGEHSSVEDARIVMEIYKLHKQEWEQTMYKQRAIALKPHSW